MSIESMVRALRLPDLTAAEKLLMVGIANHDGDGGAWPSIDTLATYLCCTPRNVRLTLRKLEARGLVTVDEQSGGTSKTRSDRRPNLYHLHFDGRNCASARAEDGVKPSAPREEAQRVDGRKPTSAEPSLNHPEPSASPPKAKSEAHLLVEQWWETRNPKPAQRFIAIVKVVEHALRGGWTPVELRAALDAVPTVSGSTLDFWRKQRAPETHADAQWVIVAEWLTKLFPTMVDAAHAAFEALGRWKFAPGEIAIRMAVMSRGNPVGITNATQLSHLDRVDRFTGGVCGADMDRARAAGSWRVAK